MNEHHQPFEEIKLINANGAEQWSARQLGKLLGYSEYRHFIPVLTRAKEACLNSGHTIDDHFEEILDMVKIGSNAKRALMHMVWLPVHLNNLTFEFSGCRIKCIPQLFNHSSVKQFSAVFCRKKQMHNKLTDTMPLTEESLQ